MSDVRKAHDALRDALQHAIFPGLDEGAARRKRLEAADALDRLAESLMRHERSIATIEVLPPVVFASDDKEREMLAKGVVLRILRGSD